MGGVLASLPPGWHFATAEASSCYRRARSSVMEGRVFASRAVSTWSWRSGSLGAGARVDVGRNTSSGLTIDTGCYTHRLTLLTTLRRLEMNPEKSEKTTSLSGSIAVYQRLQSDKRPAKVEVIRAVYEKHRSPDGFNFGRTVNTVLLRLPSGLECLSIEDTAVLAEHGLNESEIARVNLRLSDLAGPARARALEMDVAEAKAKIDWIVELAESTPLVAEEVCDLVRAAGRQLAVGDVASANLPESDAAGPREALKDALVAINRACEEAQLSYKRLPKGDLLDDVVMEFQRSWFSYQDLLTTLTVRKSMARPAGWSKLRAQVCAGRMYRKDEASHK